VEDPLDAEHGAEEQGEHQPQRTISSELAERPFGDPT